MKERELAGWEATKTKGIATFVLKWGVLWWGILTLTVRLVVEYFFLGKEMDVEYILFNSALHLVAGALFAFMLWVFNEVRYSIKK